MTISYSGNFAKLLVRWKGSVWKTAWKELISFLLMYYLIRIVYRYGFKDEHKAVFEKVIIEFDDYTKRVPLTFLLGFYIAAVVKRWWEQFQYIAWPDSCLQSLCFFMRTPNPDDEDTIARRRAIARYLNLCACLAYRDLSARVRKRFPTLEHLVRAELMTEDELSIYKSTADCAKWMLPLQWAQDLVAGFARDHSIPAPYVVTFLNRMYDYRSAFHKLFCYDWVCIPLVYTQVAALATYGYFFMCLIGRQFIEFPRNSTNSITFQSCTRFCYDYYVPIFSILEFLFYVGWFKVGQDLMRPFEEDDDDYELNYILDRNIRMSVAMVNDCVQQKPQFPPKTQFKMWENPHSADVPYTKLCKPEKNHPPKMHAYVKVKNNDDSEFLRQDLEKQKSIEANVKREQTKRWRYF